MYWYSRKYRKLAEQSIGRPLKRDANGKCLEVVHHKDGNPLNNDPKNLAVCSIEQHGEFHRIERLYQMYLRITRMKPKVRINLLSPSQVLRSLDKGARHNCRKIKEDINSAREYFSMRLER